MLKVPARKIAFPRVEYHSGLESAIGSKGKPQWTLERKDFLERDLQDLSRQILVLRPVQPNGGDVDAQITHAFAQECVEFLGMELVVSGSLSSEKELKRGDFQAVVVTYAVSRDKELRDRLSYEDCRSTEFRF